MDCCIKGHGRILHQKVTALGDLRGNDPCAGIVDDSEGL